MNIRLLCIGKTNDNNIDALFHEYENRLRYYGNIKVEYLTSKKRGDEKQVVRQEGTLIMNSIKPNSILIILDEKGEVHSSISFSRFLQKRMNQSSGEIVFVIGGAYGFSEEIYQRANFKLALSAMTFTHQMVRLIFIEQLYRAFTILKGEKYHH